MDCNNPTINSRLIKTAFDLSPLSLHTMFQFTCCLRLNLKCPTHSVEWVYCSSVSVFHLVILLSCVWSKFRACYTTQCLIKNLPLARFTCSEKSGCAPVSYSNIVSNFQIRIFQSMEMSISAANNFTLIAPTDLYFWDYFTFYSLILSFGTVPAGLTSNNNRFRLWELNTSHKVIYLVWSK